MTNWLRGGFEMDRKGNWRLKPQVADTLQRDVQAIMTQTGWERSIARSAQDQTGLSIPVSGDRRRGECWLWRTIEGSPRCRCVWPLGWIAWHIQSGKRDDKRNRQHAPPHRQLRRASGNGQCGLAVCAIIQSIRIFATELVTEILGSGGLRKRYLGDVTSGREVTDVTAPLTPLEQSSLLNSDRFSTDMASAAFDGDPQFKKGAD